MVPGLAAPTTWPCQPIRHRLTAAVATSRQGRPRLPLHAHATPDTSGISGTSSDSTGNDVQQTSPRRGRHPELLRLVSGGGRYSQGQCGGDGRQCAAAAVAAAEEHPRPEEVDARYRRADYSDVFQFEARQAFARCIAGGEPRMRLAEAALHVSAEDDAIASHSTVRFPVGPWLERVEGLVDDLCRKDWRRAAAAAAAAPVAATTATVGPGGGDGGVHDMGRGRDHELEVLAAAEAGAVLRVAERYLFEEVGFRMPEYGRSNLPANCVVDHAGVWEDPRLAYLHETLVRRLGHPAALGLLLGEVTSRLLARGLLPCAAAIDTRSYRMLPRAIPLPALTRERLLVGSEAAAEGAPGGWGSSNLAGLNTCTSEVLVELLRHLKRSYWPFPWDTAQDASAQPHAVGSHGGFRGAAKAAMGEDVSAVLAAIGKVAAWRLERGIWTSPGAGDLRRARAACERLVLLAGERCPEERRDLAVLLLHCGELGAARLELRTYLRAVADTVGRPTPNPTSSTSTSLLAAAEPGGGRWHPGTQQSGPDPFDLLLCRRLLQALEGPLAHSPAPGTSGSGGGAGAGLEEPAEPLGMEATLRAVPPWERPAVPGSSSRPFLPLTW